MANGEPSPPLPLAVRMLLAHPDLDLDPLEEVSGSTPLHLAINWAHMELARELLEAGADVYARNYDGNGVIDLIVPEKQGPE